MRLKTKETVKKGKCFACKKKTRVERDNGSRALMDAVKKNEYSPDQWLNNFAKRLKVMTSNVDIFAADLMYHQPCYNSFIYIYEGKSRLKTEITTKEIKRKVSIQKNCYLLINLVEEIVNLDLLCRRKGK